MLLMPHHAAIRCYLHTLYHAPPRNSIYALFASASVLQRMVIDADAAAHAAAAMLRMRRVRYEAEGRW